jgi:hypothetical protein
MAIANTASGMEPAAVGSVMSATSVPVVLIGPIVGIAATIISVIGAAITVAIITSPRQRERKRSQAKGCARDRRPRIPPIIPMIVSVMVTIVPIMMPVAISDRRCLGLLWRDELRTRNAHRTREGGRGKREQNRTRDRRNTSIIHNKSPMSLGNVPLAPFVPSQIIETL